MLGWGRSSRTPFAKTRKSWRTTGRTRAASRGTRSRRPHATHSSMPRGMAALPRTRQTLGMRLHCIRGLPGAGPRFHAHSALQAGCRLSLPHELAWRYSRDSSAATRLGSTFDISGLPKAGPLDGMVRRHFRYGRSSGKSLREPLHDGNKLPKNMPPAAMASQSIAADSER